MELFTSKVDKKIEVEMLVNFSMDGLRRREVQPCGSIANIAPLMRDQQRIEFRSVRLIIYTPLAIYN